MKSLTFLLLVAITAQAQANLLFDAFNAFTAIFVNTDDQLSLAQRAVTAADRTRCRWTEKISQEEEDEIRAKQFYNLTRKQQCFIKCVTDSFIFAEAAVELLDIDKSQFNKILKPLLRDSDVAVLSAKCEDLKGSDDCETSAIKYNCYFKLNATYLI